MYLEEVMGVMERVCFGKHRQFEQHITERFSLFMKSMRVLEGGDGIHENV